jgi:hypothetical protein
VVCFSSTIPAILLSVEPESEEQTSVKEYSMLDFLMRATGDTVMDALLHDAASRWRRLAESSHQLSSGELEALYPAIPPDVEIPQAWASCYYLLPYVDQTLLAFAWLHWWQQSQTVEPGFGGWLQRGPGFALNHVSFLRVLTQGQGGVLGILHRFLETVLEGAGDWNGDRVTFAGRATAKTLEELDAEYRYNIHDRDLWPAVLQLLQTEDQRLP